MKRKVNKEVVQAVVSLVVIVALFLLVSYYVHENLDLINSYVGESILGRVVYVSIFALAIVVAPISSFPLIPLGSQLYGWKIAGVLAIIGWTIGAVVAFLLARRYGKPLVKKLVSLESIERFEKYLPQNNVFFSIMLLRLTLPTDGLSYALGLFSDVKFKIYFWATIIGITPFAFIYAYLGTLEFKYQIIGLVISLVLVGFILYFGYLNNKKLLKK